MGFFVSRLAVTKQPNTMRGTKPPAAWVVLRRLLGGGERRRELRGVWAGGRAVEGRLGREFCETK